MTPVTKILIRYPDSCALHMCYLRRMAKIQFFAGISDLIDIAAEEKQKLLF